MDTIDIIAVVVGVLYVSYKVFILTREKTVDSE